MCSALATTRRLALQLASVIHMKSLNRRAGLPVSRLSAAASAIVSGQEKIFKDQASAISSQIEVWQSRAEQSAVQITSQKVQIVSLDNQEKLIGEELKDAK